MKKLIPVILTTLLLLACDQEKSSETRLQEQILKAYDNPIRPGYEGCNPYWNKFAKKFMYAPAFDFKSIDGAHSYVYTVRESVQDSSARSWSFTAVAPNLALTPIWKDIAIGDVELKVEAIDKDGNVLGLAGERSFYRDTPFTPPYHGAVRDYKESAMLAMICIHNMEPIQNWMKGPHPDMSYNLNTYPAKIVSSTISMEVLLSEYCPELKEEKHSTVS